MIHCLKEYAARLKDDGLLACSCEYPETAVRGLTYDSRNVSEGTLFVCKGAHFKVEYLHSAVKDGAVAYVSEADYGAAIPCLKVSDIRRAMVSLAEIFYDNAPSRLTIAGITGTKGKSTTTYYVKSILDRFLGRECAVFSSIDNYDGIEREESHLTTQEAMEIHRRCANAVRSGISHLVMEVSSQALKYGRTEGIKFAVGAFLNIGTDHISPIEHADFDDYFSSKLKIFSQCGTAVVNRACEHAEKILARAEKDCGNVVTFGIPGSNFYAEDVAPSREGISFTLVHNGGRYPVSLCMTGLFNVENALCAAAVCRSLGVPFDVITEGLAHATAPGRMEVFTSLDGKKTVIVDYAHNRLSFDALYSSASREYPGCEIIGVFGCPGMKALGRRRELPESAAAYASYVIVTEEDSGEEPFEKIAADVASALEKTGCPFCVTEDREQAVKKAILESGDRVVVLLTGKGRETRMKRGTLYIDTPSDVDFTLKYLGQYDNEVNGEKS